MPQSLTDILIVVAAIFLLWLVIRLFRKPIRWILKLLLNTAIGFAALFALNFFGSAVGITLGLNWINGEKMSESKQCRNMFLLAGGSLALLMLLPNPWLYLYAS